MMAYIGKSSGFSQRNFNITVISKSPDLAIRKRKVSVKSTFTLDLIREDVESFNTPTPCRPENELFDSVVRDAVKAYVVHRVNPIHLNDIPLFKIDVVNQSPGLPWVHQGFKTKQQILLNPDEFQRVRKFWHIIKAGEDIKPPDCSAFFRVHAVQQGGHNVRVIMRYPATISFQESCFAQPLIDAYKEKGPIAYGFEKANDGRRKITMEFCHFNHFLSPVYKSFDKSIPAWLIRIAFDILLLNMDLTKYAIKGVPHSRNLYRCWCYIVDYFINTGIRLCNGEKYRKNKGVPSGSYFTELIGSIVNWIVTTYALRKQARLVQKLIVMGDHALAAIDYKVDLNQFAEAAAECGMIIDRAETRQSDDLAEMKFLGYKLSNGAPTEEHSVL